MGSGKGDRAVEGEKVDPGHEAVRRRRITPVHGIFTATGNQPKEAQQECDGKRAEDCERARAIL